MNTLSKYGGAYIELTSKLESEMERLGQLKIKYASSKINMEQTLPKFSSWIELLKPNVKQYPGDR